MIDAERIAELRENIRTGHLLVRGVGADVADLLAILSDYEAALPLLVLVKSEKASQIRLDTQTIEEAWAEGESAGISILRAALAYKERSGG